MLLQKMLRDTAIAFIESKENKSNPLVDKMTTKLQNSSRQGINEIGGFLNAKESMGKMADRGKEAG